MSTHNMEYVLGQHFATGTKRWISSSPRMLVYTPYATKKQLDIIGWMRDDYPVNRNEQGGLLIGYEILDHFGNPIQGEVTEVLEAQTECRFPGYIEWDAMEEIRLQRLFFQIKDECAKTDPESAERMRILGWWHTHPNTLDVFLSNTDLETVRLKYYKPEKYSIVLNPHRGLFRAFSGENAIEVPVIMLCEKNDNEGLLYDSKGNSEKTSQKNTRRRRRRRIKKRWR